MIEHPEDRWRPGWVDLLPTPSVEHYTLEPDATKRRPVGFKPVIIREPLIWEGDNA